MIPAGSGAGREKLPKRQGQEQEHQPSNSAKGQAGAFPLANGRQGILRIACPLVQFIVSQILR